MFQRCMFLKRRLTVLSIVHTGDKNHALFIKEFSACNLSCGRGGDWVFTWKVFCFMAVFGECVLLRFDVALGEWEEEFIFLFYVFSWDFLGR